MEHLHFDGADQVDPLLVPYYGAVEYDGGDWSTYPERMGHAPTSLFALCDPPDSQDAAADKVARSVLQEWLWFGVLHEFCSICGVTYDRRDFVSRDGRHLNTEALPLLAERVLRSQIDNVLQADNPAYVTWLSETVLEKFGYEGPLSKEYLDGSVAKQTAAPLFRMECLASHIAKNDPAVNQRQIRLADCLCKAADALSAMYDNWQMLELRSWDFLACFVSCILVKSLVCLGNRLHSALESKLSVKTPIFIAPVWRLMAPRSGQCIWCISRNSIGDISQDYVSMTMVKRNEADHAACTNKQCDPVFPDPYIGLPGHSVTCLGSCSLVELPHLVFEKLNALYDERKYGVLRITASEDDSSVFEVLEPGPDVEYVCISHVWAHGLGNPHGNAVSKCHLALITERARQAHPTAVAIWLDTLCVPLTQPHKRIAISRMNAIYKDAAAVLVLDRDLLATGQSVVEQATRLLLCDWMQRLWTLAEALLAHERLCIAFQKEIKSLKDLHLDILANTDLRARVFWEAFSKQIAAEFRVRSDRPMLLPDLAQHFHRRTTSHAADEPICLAALLGLDLLALPSHLTLRDVFAALAIQNQLPSDLLLTPGPRMKEKGFGWAPDSFLGCNSYVYSENQEAATLTADGMCIIRDGFVANERIHIELQDEHVNQYSAYYFAIPDEHGAPDVYFSFEREPSQWVERPAFLFHERHSILMTVMVSRLREDAGCQYVRYVTRILCRPAASFKTRHDMRRILVTKLTGARISGTKWCIQ